MISCAGLQDLTLADLVSVSHNKGKMATKMVFEFSDGSGAIVEAANIGKPEVFIERPRKALQLAYQILPLTTHCRSANMLSYSKGEIS